MKRITIWSPSTCKCVIHYEWDDTHHEDIRKHKVVHVEHCGQNHPKAVEGEQVEGSAFHTHHVNLNRGQ